MVMANSLASHYYPLYSSIVCHFDFIIYLFCFYFSRLMAHLRQPSPPLGTKLIAEHIIYKKTEDIIIHSDYLYMSLYYHYPCPFTTTLHVLRPLGSAAYKEGTQTGNWREGILLRVNQCHKRNLTTDFQLLPNS